MLILLETSFSYDSATGRFSGGPWDSPNLPIEQSTFDNLDQHVLDKAERTARREAHHSRRPSWKYDSPEYQLAMRSGSITVDSSQGKEDYLDWLEDTSIVHLRNLDGESIKVLGSKRGNPAYARKYWKKYQALLKVMNGFEFSRSFGGRNHLQRCFAIMATLTYDQSIMTPQDAWAMVPDSIAKLKIQWKRDLGLSNIEVICCKEGTKTDYPAPHLFIVLSHPVVCFAHRSTHKKHFGKITYRLKDYDLLQKLQSRWKYGFVDVQGVVDGDVIDPESKVQMSAPKYLLKYLMKSVHVSEGEDISSNTAINSMFWTKLLRLRPLHISKSFRQRFVRLDTFILNRNIDSGLSWFFVGIEHCKLGEYLDFLYSPPPDHLQNLANRTTSV